jgi:hypothetical protein
LWRLLEAAARHHAAPQALESCGGPTALLVRIIAKGARTRLHAFVREVLFDPKLPNGQKLLGSRQM